MIMPSEPTMLSPALHPQRTVNFNYETWISITSIDGSILPLLIKYDLQNKTNTNATINHGLCLLASAGDITRS